MVNPCCVNPLGDVKPTCLTACGGRAAAPRAARATAVRSGMAVAGPHGTVRHESCPAGGGVTLHRGRHPRKVQRSRPPKWRCLLALLLSPSTRPAASQSTECSRCVRLPACCARGPRAPLPAWASPEVVGADTPPSWPGRNACIAAWGLSWMSAYLLASIVPTRCEAAASAARRGAAPRNDFTASSGRTRSRSTPVRPLEIERGNQ
jgi:hypothetical protein